METGYRGFLLTGREEFLQPYLDGREQYHVLQQQLLQLTAESPIQTGRWQTIDQLAEAWQQEVTQPTIDNRRRIPPNDTDLDGIVSTVATSDGKQRMDHMRAIFAEAIATEQIALEARQVAQTDSDARLLAVLVWGTLTAAMFSLLLGSWVFRYLQRERLAGVRLAIQTTEHELYNQLAGASGNVQLLQREQTLSFDQRRWADRAYASINTSARIIHDMHAIPELKEVIWSSDAMVRTIKLPA
jgi:CHASE3 domain sensor protein